MDGILATVPTAMCASPRISRRTWDWSKPICYFPGKSPSPPVRVLQTGHFFSLQMSVSSNSNDQYIRKQHCSRISHLFVRSATCSVRNVDYTEEPATGVKFQRSVTIPGCSSPLSLLGTGYRERTIAIIGVKVYAAGLYINESILSGLRAWKGRSAVEIQNESSFFSSIFQAPAEKLLQIVLVRDVDGETFWDALDEAISPRIKSPSSDDKYALSTFRSIFQGRPLNKGTFIFLTWLEPLKMLVCVSSGGFPTSVDAMIESVNVTSALFDVFFGGSPVSPTLKSSVVNQLAALLK